MNSYTNYRDLDNSLPSINRSRLLEHRSQTGNSHIRTAVAEDGTYAFSESRQYAPGYNAPPPPPPAGVPISSYASNAFCPVSTSIPVTSALNSATAEAQIIHSQFASQGPLPYPVSNAFSRTDAYGAVAMATNNSGPCSRTNSRPTSPANIAPVPHYPRPPSPSHRKHMYDLQDQLKIFKEELTKKDRLISQLTTLDNSRPRCTDIYSNENMSINIAQSGEVAKLTVQLEGLQNQIRELQAQSMIKDDKLREFKAHSELGRENESRINVTVQSLRKQLAMFESRRDEYEGNAGRSEVAIITLQKEKQDSASRIVELESRIRTNLVDRESAEQQRDIIQKKLNDIMSVLSQYDGIANYDAACSDILIQRIEDIFKENQLLKGKSIGIKEHLLSIEAENKASRETIVRLVGETERIQQYSAKHSHEFESLKNDKHTLEACKLNFEREVISLNERLSACQRALSSTKSDLLRYEDKFVSLDRHAQSHSVLAQSAETKMKTFLEQLSHLLSLEGHSRCDPYEESIRDRVTLLAMECRDKETRINAMDTKIISHEEQRLRDYERQKSLEHAGQRADVAVKDYESRLHQLDTQILSAQYEGDRLRGDKDKYMQLLEELMREMGIDSIGQDVGFDMMCDTIVTRSRQLRKLENDSITERKTQVYNLQRKMKLMKDQIESKEVHLEMMRKKISGLENKLSGRSELERDRDDIYVRAKKLEKCVDRYKRELCDVNEIVRDLKAKLLETVEIKNDNMGKHQLINELENAVNKLEQVRIQQSTTISSLQEEKNSNNELVASKRQTASNTIHALSSELKTTKCALTENNVREKQLLDFRQVISRMLGLDVNCLAVPDYEIISRLEKLILANKSNVATVVALDGVIGGLEDGFKAGYEDAGRILANGTAFVPMASGGGARTRSSVTYGSSANRSRSMSPTRRRRDKRVY